MSSGVNPYFIFDGNAQEAVKFYEKALEAKLLGIQTFGDLPPDPQMQVPEEAKSRVMHAHLEIGGTALMISDNFPGQPYTVGSNVTVAVNSVDAGKTKRIYTNLLEGGQETMPLAETPFSPLYGQVTDKYGITWHVSTDSAK